MTPKTPQAHAIERVWEMKETGQSRRRVTTYLTTSALASAIVATCSMTFAQDVAPSALPSDVVVYSPYPDQDFPNRVLFGDTHLHTASSADAGLVGAILTPDDAYRYARGEVVTSNTGLKAKLARPLDFLVITDHSENLGLPTAMFNEDPVLTSIPWGQEIIKRRGNGDIDGMRASYEFWSQ